MFVSGLLVFTLFVLVCVHQLAFFYIIKRLKMLKDKLVGNGITDNQESSVPKNLKTYFAVEYFV